MSESATSHLPKTAAKEVSIFTRPGNLIFKGCLTHYAKFAARKMLRIKRGPDVVLNSLVRGLNEAGIAFNINPPMRDASPIVHVISNPEALRWAIRHKKSGRFKKLVAGPNVSVLPTDDDGVLADPNIDAILVPSTWSKDAHVQSVPSIASKIRVWPAGVAIPELSETQVASQQRKAFQLILFIKQVPQEIVDAVTSELFKQNINFKTLKYGAFLQKEYFDLLRESSGMIYLQQVESQGIALQEAWSFDVPTLVWNKGQFTYPGTEITVYGNISAPYLKGEAGMFFNGAEDFPDCLDAFLARLDYLKPREYCISNLSDLASAHIYKSILEE